MNTLSCWVILVTMIILVVEVLPPPRLASQLFGSRLVSTSPQIIVTEKQTNCLQLFTKLPYYTFLILITIGDRATECDIANHWTGKLSSVLRTVQLIELSPHNKSFPLSLGGNFSNQHLGNISRCKIYFIYIILHDCSNHMYFKMQKRHC